MLRLKFQIQAYLDHLGISAAQLSRKAAVPRQTISHWLGGGEPRKLTQLRRVAQVLGTDLDNLLFGESVCIERKIRDSEALDLVLGDEWVSGQFEIKLRRIKK